MGQNIAQYWNDVAPEVQWRRVIRSWYDEVGDWSSADTSKFRYTDSSPGRSCRPTQTHTHLTLCVILQVSTAVCSECDTVMPGTC